METKSWFKSKTIWGAIIMLGSLILTQVTGVQISPEEQDTTGNLIIGIVEGLGSLIGLILVIVGRIKATKKIGASPSDVAKKAAMILICIMLAASMTSCAFLKPASDIKLTEDETTRLVAGGFQDASGVLFDAGKMFILAQPQYQGEWKIRIVPCFNQINKFLGGMAAGGSAGLKITPQLIVNQLKIQVMDIVMVYTQWGTVPDAKYEKPTPAQSALIIVAGIQAGTILYDQLIAFSGGKIQTWEAIIVKNTALQAKIDAEK